MAKTNQPLSEQGVLNRAWDESAGALKTTATIATADIEIGAVEIKNATDDTRAVVGANGLSVDVKASVLPTGAATEAGNLATIAGDTTSLDGKVTACNTGAVVVASGAITETNSGSVKTAVELLDDTVYTDGSGTPSKGVLILGSDGTNPQAVSTNTAGEMVVAPKTTIGHGVKAVTTAGTDEAIAASTACKMVIVQAQTDNTGWVAVGAAGVDATEATGSGVLLDAGEAIKLEIANLASVFVDATVSGDGVRFTYLV